MVEGADGEGNFSVRRKGLWVVCRYVGWDNVLPFPALVLELAGVAAHVRGHASPAGVSVPIVVVVVFVHAWAQTHCTPKSPVLKTSIRFNPKHANISTLHRPRPRTATSFSMSSSSLALTSIRAVSSPFANFSARPEMYSALR
jgi:hypothetical protein